MSGMILARSTLPGLSSDTGILGRARLLFQVRGLVLSLLT